jgi:hypothetical protein
MRTEIKFNKGNVLIDYCDNTQDISICENEIYSNPMRITFMPNTTMTECICLEYTNSIMDKVIEEGNKIINKNVEVFKNFEINFNSHFSAYCLHRSNENLIVSQSGMHVNCKFKKSFE